MNARYIVSKTVTWLVCDHVLQIARISSVECISCGAACFTQWLKYKNKKKERFHLVALVPLLVALRRNVNRDDISTIRNEKNMALKMSPLPSHTARA